MERNGEHAEEMGDGARMERNGEAATALGLTDERERFGSERFGETFRSVASRRSVLPRCAPSMTWMCALMLLVFLIKYLSSGAMTSTDGVVQEDVGEIVNLLYDLVLGPLSVTQSGYVVQKGENRSGEDIWR